MILPVLLGILTTSTSQHVATNYCHDDCVVEYRDFKHLAREGSSLALFAIGIMNILGHGVDADPKRGVEILKRAARLGEPSAIFQLGYFYMKGLYVDKDYEKALLWLQKISHFNIRDTQARIAYLKSNSQEHSYKERKLKLNNVKLGTTKVKSHSTENQKNVASDMERISISYKYSYTDLIHMAAYQSYGALGKQALVPLILAADED